eukprot:tig00020610_g12032.t1
MEDGPPTEDFSSLSLEQRLVHKNVGCRQQAFKELHQAFRCAADNDSVYDDYADLLKKMVQENNNDMKSQAFDCAVELINHSPRAAARIAGELSDVIVEKCLTARGCAKERGFEVCLLFIEQEANGPAVVEAMVKGMSLKAAKAVAAAVELFTQALREFGAKVVNPKPVLNKKLLQAMLDSKDTDVRSNTKSMIVELYRWLKEAIRPMLEDARDVQKKELDVEFGKIPASDRPAPTRLTKSAKPKAGAAAPGAAGPAAGVPGAAAAVAAAPDVDPLEFFDPVDLAPVIEKELHKNWAEWILTLEKWAEKKEALEALQKKAIEVRRIAPSDYGDVMRSMKRLMGDSNLAVVTQAMKTVAAFAAGMRKDFRTYSSLFVPVLLDRLKETKALFTAEVRQTLEAIHSAGCFSVIDLLEEVKEGWNKPKVPAGWKVQVMVFFEAAIGAGASVPPALQKGTGAIAELLVKALEDSTKEVRDAGQKSFVKLVSVVGQRPLEATISALEKRKQEALRALLQQASGAGAGPAAPAAAAAAPAPASRPASASAKAAPAAAAPASAPAPPAKKPVAASATSSSVAPAKKGGAAAGGKKGGAAAKPAEERDDDVADTMTPEQLEAAMAELLPEDARKLLGGEKWQEKKEGMQKVQEFVSGMAPEELAAHGENLVRYVSRLLAKENNFMVCTAALNAITEVVKASEQGVSKKVAGGTIGAAWEKLSDAKLGRPATECLLTIAECTGPSFVCGRLYAAYGGCTKQNPKLHASVLAFVQQAVEEFGHAPLQLKGAIEFMQGAFEATNPTVKVAATKLLVALRLRVGPAIRAYFEAVKPALLQSIDAELAKVNDGEPVAPPTRSLRAKRAAGPAAGASAGKPGAASAAAAAAYEEEEEAGGLPRTDVSGQVTGKLLAELGDKDWKVRAAAMKSVEDEILRPAAFRITGDGLSDLMAAVKQRINDSNKNLGATAMLLCAQLASSMGPAFGGYFRGVLPSICANLSDQKKNVRDAAVKALEATAAACGFAAMVEAVAKEMKMEAALGRQTLLAWMLAALPEDPAAAGCDMGPLVRPAVGFLQDKTAEVRDSAVKLLAACARCLGINALLRETKDLPTATKLALEPLVERIRAEAGPGGVAASARPRGPASPKGKEPASGPRAGVGCYCSAPAAPAPAAAPAATARAAPAAPAAAARKGLTASSAGAGGLRGSGTRLGTTPEAPLRANEGKERRNPKKAAVQTIFQEPNATTMDSLRDALLPIAVEQVHAQMFSKEHQKQAQAAGDIAGAAPVFRRELIDNLDLVFRWAAVRICENNTSVVLKCTELLSVALRVCEEEGYTLADYETNGLCPYIVEKVGSNQKAVRDALRGIFREVCKVYPPSKFCMYVVEGLRSKNFKARAECLDELERLIDTYGLEQVCRPAKDLPLAAACIGAADKAVREAALKLLARVYAICGEEMWRAVGRLPDKDRALLDQRLLRIARDGGGGPGPASAPSSSTNLRAAPLAIPAPGASSEPASPSSPIGRRSGPGAPLNATPRTPGAQQQNPRASMPGGVQATPMAGHAAFSLDHDSPFSRLNGHAIASVAAAAAAAAVTAVVGQQQQQPAHVPVTPTRASVAGLPSYAHRAQTLPAPYQGRPGLPDGFRPGTAPSGPPRTPPGTESSQAPPAGGSTAAAALATPALRAPRRSGRELLAMLANREDGLEPIEALKVLCQECSEGNDAAFAADADALLSALAALLRASFAGASVDTRLCKYVLNTLMQVFQKRVIPVRVTRAPLETLVAELLERILDERLPALDADAPGAGAGAEADGGRMGSNLLRAMNLLMLKLLEASERTVVFVVLLQCLRRACAAAAGHGPGAPGRAPHEKLKELVIKCLLKVIKSLPGAIAELDVGRLLLELHVFVDAYTASAGGVVAAQGDLPMRTARTLLSELVKLQGAAIVDAMAGVPPSAELYRWAEALLMHHTSPPAPAAAAPLPVPHHHHPVPLDTAPAPASGPVSSAAAAAAATAAAAAYRASIAAASAARPATAPALPASHSLAHAGSAPAGMASPLRAAAEEGDARVTEIIKRIGCKETSNQGLVELYKFIGENGQDALEREMGKYGRSFQEYIRRNLAKIREQHERLARPATAPGPAPGPAAPRAPGRPRACAGPLAPHRDAQQSAEPAAGLSSDSAAGAAAAPPAVDLSKVRDTASRAASALGLAYGPPFQSLKEKIAALRSKR